MLMVVEALLGRPAWIVGRSGAAFLGGFRPWIAPSLDGDLLVPSQHLVGRIPECGECGRSGAASGGENPPRP